MTDTPAPIVTAGGYRVPPPECPKCGDAVAWTAGECDGCGHAFPGVDVDG